jgi:purine-binding chemotaxis protein CheW
MTPAGPVRRAGGADVPFESRKPVDPATPKAPRKRAAARPAASQPEPVEPDALPVMPEVPVVPVVVEPLAAVVPDVVSEVLPDVPTGTPETSVFGATRPKRVRAARGAAAASTAPSVEEPATLLRDDRIPLPKAAAAAAPPIAVTPSTAAAPADAPAPANLAAAGRDADVEADATHEAVVVTLGGGRYGVAMDAVDEVGRPPSVTRVPGLPAWLAGVANWRGRVLAVLDLRPLLAAPQVPLGRNGRLVVCSMDGVTVGLLTEEVEGVVTVERATVEQPLVTLSGQAAQLVAGQVRDPRGPVALLDLDAVFALRGQLPRARRAG